MQIHSMSQNLQIAPAEPEDFEWSARLMASTDPWITLRADLALCLDRVHAPGRELWMAREGNQRLGFILLAPNGFAGSPYVASFCLAPEARSRGVGAALLEFAERHFAGRRFLFLLCSSFNQRAQKFYLRQGFTITGELKDYIVPGHSELIFWKPIAGAAK